MRALNEVLTLTRPLIGLDEETTGVDPRTCAICQLGLQIFSPDGTVKEWKTLVNPMMPIPKGATEVHGITNEMVKDAPTFRQLAGNLLAGLVNCDFVGFNVRFDLRQIFEEFKRAGATWDYEGARILDGYRLWQVLQGRTLRDAIDHWLGPHMNEGTGVDDDGQAHDALWDIRWSTRVVAAQIEQRNLPRDLDELHKLQWPDWFDSDGKLRYIDGRLCLTFGEHRNKPLADVPQGYLRWIIKSDFSEKVKNECRALLTSNHR